MDSRLITLFLRFSTIFPQRISFDALRTNLAKASVKMSNRAYLGLMTFTSITIGVAAFVASILLLPLLNLQFLYTVVVSSLIAVLVGVLVIGALLYYLKLVASSRAKKIDANLPTVANFMSVLASSGMPPGSIIRSLARVGEEYSISEQTTDMIRDFELMGLDLKSTLRKASERSPSKKFAGMLDGIIATSHMGGDLAGYLREQADKYKKDRMLTMKNFLENLGVISEVYVTFMVAAPLMIIVMLSVMSFIGGGVGVGGLNPRFLLDLLSFVITPIGVGILILIVDIISPLR